MSAPDERPSTAPPAEPGDEDRSSHPSRSKKLVERLIKRGFESGIGAISKSEDTVRGVLEGLKVPKEVALLALDQIDETKNGLYRAVAKELRDFLESTNFAGELKKALTGLAFEVKMEVRFKDTGEGDGRTKLAPEVSADVAVRDRTAAPSAGASTPGGREGPRRRRRLIE